MTRKCPAKNPISFIRRALAGRAHQSWNLAPEKFSCDTLNIPESGNGIPDIIDQVKWEVDWLAKMVSANGAVFNKVSFPTWEKVLPQARTNETDKMWAITKTTRDTALACGALAKAARIFGENGWYATDVAAWSNKAELAWQCLQIHTNSYPLNPPEDEYDYFQNPTGKTVYVGGEYIVIPDIGTGPYYKSASDADDMDERMWAALEMHILTGSNAWWNIFSNLVVNAGPYGFHENMGNLLVNDWHSQPSNVSRLYPIAFRDAACSNAVAEAIDRLTGAYETGYNHWRYKTSLKNSFTYIQYGTLSMSSRWSLYHILCYELSGDSDHLEMGKQNLDFQLGANPLSTTFITGIGDKSPLHPHCKISEYDGIEESIPGFSVYGLAHSLEYKGYYIPIRDNAWPLYTGGDPAYDYYPTARKFVDAYEPVMMGEFVIDDMARTAMAFGYFSSTNDVYQP